MLLDYKTAYRAIVIVGQKYPKSQWNRIENPKIDLHVQRYLIYGRGVTEDRRKRTFFYVNCSKVIEQQ